MSANLQSIDNRIILRYTDQPPVLPPVLRGLIERTLRDADAGTTAEASILLYAFADLDDAFRLAQTWVAVGRAHVAVARLDAAGEVADLRVFERSQISAVHEAAGLSATALTLVGAPGFTLVVHATGDASVASEIQRVARDVDPAVLISPQSLEDRFAAEVRPTRLVAIFAGLLGAIATLLAIIGVYGAIAYAVSRRRREIGIRFALGAAQTDILGLILRQSVTPVVGGIAAVRCSPSPRLACCEACSSAFRRSTQSRSWARASCCSLLLPSPRSNPLGMQPIPTPRMRCEPADRRSIASCLVHQRHSRAAPG